MNGNIDLQIDSQTLEQCLKSINNFGKTTYQNICTGQVTVVPWGALEWIVVLILIMIGLAMAGMMLRMILDF